MKTRTITLKEYCELSGYSYKSNWVQKHLAQGNMLIGMVSFRKFGASYAISVLEEWYQSKQTKS